MRDWSPAASTRMTREPVSSVVPAKTTDPSRLEAASDSPVMAAWLTSASPDSTVPSTGMTFPASTRIFSPGRICSMGTWHMPPSSTRQTRSIFMLRLAASAARVFFRV